MRQSAGLFVDPIAVYSYAYLFNCTMVGQTSDSMTALTKALVDGLVPDACLWLVPPWLNLKFSLALTICESQAFFFVLIIVY